MYSKRDFCCPLGNNVVRLSHVSGWLLIRTLHVFEFIATQWVFSTVSWQIFCGFSGWALAPFAVCFCCLSDGETQIWLGDLRLALGFWFVFWLF